MFLTSLTGVCMGLLVSTLVHDTRTALNIIPLMLIPQIILGGALIKYEEMNRNLDLVYSIRQWTEKNTAAGGESSSKLRVPLICEFMPLRWSYESTIISQAKLNPLTSTQELLEARIQEIIAPGVKHVMSEAQRNDLDLTKQALALVSGLQDDRSENVARKLAAIKSGIASGKLTPDLVEGTNRRGVSAEEIFVNRKVLDLVTKAEMEREDYRRKSSPNVFFGTLKTLWTTREPAADGTTKEKPFRVSTLLVNFSVMLATLVLVVGSLQFWLKRQLSMV